MPTRVATTCNAVMNREWWGAWTGCAPASRESSWGPASKGGSRLATSIGKPRITASSVRHEIIAEKFGPDCGAIGDFPLTRRLQAAQQRHEEAVGLGGARRHGDPDVGKARSLREGAGAIAQHLNRFGRRLDRKSGMPGEKTPHLIAILLFQQRAGDIGNASAALQQRHGAIEHLRLLLLSLRQGARPHPPFGVGVAAPGPGAGARSVDEHEVDAPEEIVELAADRFRRSHLHVAR